MSRPSLLARSFLCLAAALFGGAAAHAQAPSSAPIVVPGHRRFLVETEVSAYRATAYVDRNGRTDAFFRAPEFLLAMARVSYSPLRRLAIGLLLPYRSSRIEPDAAPRALTASGSPGAGLFLDWSPPLSARVDGALRFAYFRARQQDGGVLTVSDGTDRYSVKGRLASSERLLAEPWTARLGFEVQYGRTRPTDQGLVESRWDLEGGRRVARAAGVELRLLLLGGYGLSTRGQQEGLFLHDLKMRRAFAGLAAEFEPASRGGGTPALDVSAEHDLYSRNALSGWRVTIGFRTGL